MKEAVSLLMFTVTDVLWFINSTITGGEPIIFSSVKSHFGKLFVINIGTLHY